MTESTTATTNGNATGRMTAYVSLCVISLALFATRAGARATLAPLIAYDELGCQKERSEGSSA